MISLNDRIRQIASNYRDAIFAAGGPDIYTNGTAGKLIGLLTDIFAVVPESGVYDILVGRSAWSHTDMLRGILGRSTATFGSGTATVVANGVETDANSDKIVTVQPVFAEESWFVAGKVTTLVAGGFTQLVGALASDSTSRMMQIMYQNNGGTSASIGNNSNTALFTDFPTLDTWFTMCGVVSTAGGTQGLFVNEAPPLGVFTTPVMPITGEAMESWALWGRPFNNSSPIGFMTLAIHFLVALNSLQHYRIRAAAKKWVMPDLLT